MDKSQGITHSNDQADNTLIMLPELGKVATSLFSVIFT
jgi:hypothetical protein